MAWVTIHYNGAKNKRGKKTGRETKEIRFYISSLPANAKQLNEVVRAHWGIENKLHWRLDVVFNEDKACIRNEDAVQNLSMVRRLALNILQKAKTENSGIKTMMENNRESFEHLLSCFERAFLNF